MFTGIIEDIGTVKVLKREKIYRLVVESVIFQGQKTGDSISVNGVCLTIAGLENTLAYFDVMKETMAKSNIGSLKANDKVNLERALKAGDRLGGHFVTGHIDCVGKIIETRDGVKVKIPGQDMKFIVPEGAVAVDGISLTIARIGKDTFTVYLVPHTIKNTTLGSRTSGDYLNVEFDVLGKYALNLRNEKQGGSKITEEFLRKKGFVKY